jgi:hypothetical protein
MEYTPDSKIIQEFLKKIDLPAFHFSKKAKSVIQKLYEQATKAHAMPPKYTKTQVTTFLKGSNYAYMDESIKTHIEGLQKQTTKVELIVQHRVYTIFFVIPEGTPANIDKYVKKINTWLQVASLYAKPGCSKTVTVYLYLTDLKKQLPKKDGFILDSENANTAFTTSCQPTTEIILYRREEWFKVFIHESFHNLGLDFIGGQDVKQKLFAIFPVKSEFKLYETYTEMWAELLNIIFINVFKQGLNPRLESLRLESLRLVSLRLENDIQTEQKFSLFQTAKILDHFGMTYSDIFDKENQKKYKEDTEIFCYFILKTLLLYNCNDFVEWLHDQQKPVPNKVEKFIDDLIIPRYNETKFIEKINELQQKCKPVFTNGSVIGATLRMTALEELL